MTSTGHQDRFLSALSGLLLLLLGLACLYCAWSTSRLAKGNVQTVQARPLLHPWPEAWLLLGDQARLVDMDIPAATHAYWQAVRHNPLLVSAWFALSRLEMAGGDSLRVRKLHAFLLSRVPFSTPWGWDRFLLAAEIQDPDALQEALNNVLEYLPGYREEAFVVVRQVWEWDEIFQRVRASSRWQVLRACMRYGDVPASVRLFERLADTDPEVATGACRDEMLDFLLSRREWAKVGALGRLQKGGVPLITNGDFESDLANTGREWRYQHVAGCDIRRRQRADGGGHALLFDFSGTQNVSGGLAWQFVPVQPDTSYVLQYQSRSDGITTDERPFLEIRGMDDRTVHAADLPLDAAGTWSERELPFRTSGNCTLIWLGLSRTKSRKLDNKIFGQLWLDDVELAPRPETITGGR